MTIIKYVTKKGKILEAVKGSTCLPEGTVIVNEYEVESTIDYGWRAPTIQELLTLVNYEIAEPACSLTDTKNSHYWSSTTLATTSFVWLVNFNYGSNDKTSANYVRCVRDTPNGLEWSKSSTDRMTWNDAFVYAKTLTDSDVYEITNPTGHGSQSS